MTRISFARKFVAAGTLAVAASAVVVVAAVAAGGSKSEHWGVIYRNTIGSPVAELRDGPYSIGAGGSVSAPPFGKGSLGIEVADKATSLAPPSEKVAFGNEVDFVGDPVLGLTDVGFRVFQTGENVEHGGPGNMPGITFEIDPNLSSTASNYSSLVWLPDAAPVVNEWTGYLDATTTGQWFLTGAAGAATGCNQTTTCSFAAVKDALDDGGDTPTILSVAVTKGRDNQWQGAVDGLRINSSVYDFERDGVKAKHA
jgi:hypothetical protein